MAAQEGAVVLSFADAQRRRELLNEPWVKREAVAQHFSVSTRTVYRWVKDGCPVKRLRGGTMRFQIGAISEWLDAMTAAVNEPRVWCLLCKAHKPEGEFPENDRNQAGICSDCQQARESRS